MTDDLGGRRPTAAAALGSAWCRARTARGRSARPPAQPVCRHPVGVAGDERDHYRSGRSSPEEIKLHSRHLKTLTKTLAPALVQAVGVGLDIAAEMLVTAGDHANRIRSEAAFAKMCDACPVPASSGRTNGRHRLCRGGNRHANAALYRAVIVRMRWHQPTIDYVARCTAEGLSKREIIRCLKRLLAHEIYHRLPPPTARPAPATTTTTNPRTA